MKTFYNYTLTFKDPFYASSKKNPENEKTLVLIRSPLESRNYAMDLDTTLCRVTLKLPRRLYRDFMTELPPLNLTTWLRKQPQPWRPPIQIMLMLAARISISNLHKNTDKSFSKTIKAFYNYIDPKTGEKAGLIGDDTYKIIWKNKDQLDSAIIYDRDYSFDFSDFKTLGAFLSC